MSEKQVENHINESVTCKHCGSIHIRKYGLYKGVQRFYCNSCKRKFKADDNLFHMKVPANQVTSALNMYFEGMSISAIRRQLQQEHNSSPSTATIYEWMQKYAQYARDSVKDYHPKVGGTWIADETVIKLDGQNIWLWDIIDTQTRFLLATRISHSRTKVDAQMLINKAIKRAGRKPSVVLTDSLPSYLDVDYGDKAEHRQGTPFQTEDSTSLIERFHGTFKARTKVMRGLKNLNSAQEFTDGWLVYYNYLRPHDSLDNQTPAKVAGIEYPYRNWAELAHNHKPSVPIVVRHTGRGELRLPRVHIGRPKKHIRITPKPPRITPAMPKLNKDVRLSK